jgi:alpha-N-acetylglucosamine transferase
MLTVASVYWKGSFRGREKIYSEEWVEKLQNMVARNLNREYRFVCLSNVDVPCERIPLEHDWPGWWSKIELFRPGLFEDRVLYLDLDLVIIDSLDPIVDFPADFALMPTPSEIRKFVNREGKWVVDRYNTSVMVFNAGVGDCLYNDFGEFAMQKLRGDQDYIGDRLPNLGTFPQGWVQKLKYLQNGKPLPETKVVLCMMGGKAPKKNTDVAKKFSWIKEAWK